MGSILFATGCGEDPRYSGNASYIGGGIYGGEQGGGVVRRATPSRTGTEIRRAEVPPLKSALENSAPIFTKAACSSGFRNCPPAVRAEHFRW